MDKKEKLIVGEGKSEPTTSPSYCEIAPELEELIISEAKGILNEYRDAFLELAK